MKSIAKVTLAITVGVLIAAEGAVGMGTGQSIKENSIRLTITGGHTTDPRDHGRPVALVAGALGVTSEVFRQAFSHVIPAPQGEEPNPDQVSRNKAALLSALGKYGVTNDRLDEVSNRYRYREAFGEIWSQRPAKIFAILNGARLVKIKIVDHGAGYTSPPKLEVSGHPELRPVATLKFSPDLETNGSIASVKLR